MGSGTGRRGAVWIGALVALAGCTGAMTPSEPARPEAKVSTPVAPVGAVPASVYDQASAAQRAQAVAGPAAGGERLLGESVAALGDPSQQGFWLKTPLVKAPVAGRIAVAGRSVRVELRPSGGAAGSGSQMSLSALRMLGVGLTELPRVRVYQDISGG